MSASTTVIVLLAVSIVLLVSVLVLEIVGTVTPSTAITQALTLLSVVSVACPSSIPANCGESSVSNERTSLALFPVRASISPVPAVLLPNILLVGICCIFAKVTASSAMVVAKEPVPLPVTSQVSVIVWSQVLIQLVFCTTISSAALRNLLVDP